MPEHQAITSWNQIAKHGKNNCPTHVICVMKVDTGFICLWRRGQTLLQHSFQTIFLEWITQKVNVDWTAACVFEWHFIVNLALWLFIRMMNRTCLPCNQLFSLQSKFLVWPCVVNICFQSMKGSEPSLPTHSMTNAGARELAHNVSAFDGFPFPFCNKNHVLKGFAVLFPSSCLFVWHIAAANLAHDFWRKSFVRLPLLPEKNWQSQHSFTPIITAGMGKFWWWSRLFSVLAFQKTECDSSRCFL